MDPLDSLSELARRFGTSAYVRGGGGNVSVKDMQTLWIKASGIALSEVSPQNLVPIDRSRLGTLFQTVPPSEPSAREAMVRDIMADSVRSPCRARASVETPLHDSFRAAYVVHTHPAWINGMTCATGGADACRRLFPDALWMDYIDPGYTLCLATRRELARWEALHGCQPAVVCMKNHGVFVAGATPDEMIDTYAMLFVRLDAEYRRAGLETVVAVAPGMASADTAAAVAFGLRAAGWDLAGPYVHGMAPFAPPAGPLTPDHIVYAKAYPFVGWPEPASLAAFRERHGYWPQMVSTRDGLYGVGVTAKAARLAAELAADGAEVVRLAAAFGGEAFLDERSRRFIETWEVEAYRQKVMQGGCDRRGGTGT